MPCRIWNWTGAKHCRKCAIYVLCTRRTVQENDFELVLSVQMETRHPVENYFGSEFWAICNRRGVMAAWNRKTWKPVEQFFACLNDPLRWNFKNSVRKFSTRTSIDVVLFKFREMLPTGNWWNCASFTWPKNTKFRLSLNLLLLRGSRPKSARVSHRQYTHNAPDFIQIRSFSAVSNIRPKRSLFLGNN